MDDPNVVWIAFEASTLVRNVIWLGLLITINTFLLACWIYWLQKRGQVIKESSGTGTGTGTTVFDTNSNIDSSVLWIGQWVKHLQTRTIGRVKTWNDKWVFVVYNCDNDWKNFRNYTGEATKRKELQVIDKPVEIKM